MLPKSDNRGLLVAVVSLLIFINRHFCVYKTAGNLGRIFVKHAAFSIASLRPFKSPLDAYIRIKRKTHYWYTDINTEGDCFDSSLFALTGRFLPSTSSQGYKTWWPITSTSYVTFAFVVRDCIVRHKGCEWFLFYWNHTIPHRYHHNHETKLFPRLMDSKLLNLGPWWWLDNMRSTSIPWISYPRRAKKGYREITHLIRTVRRKLRWDTFPKLLTVILVSLVIRYLNYSLFPLRFIITSARV